MREKFFGHFEFFFRGQKIDFTHTFIQIFTGSPLVSRGQLGVFSLKDFPFHGKKMDVFENFHVCVSFFTDRKSKFH